MKGENNPKSNLNTDYDSSTNFTGKIYKNEAKMEEKKFFNQQAEKLENKLVEEEFFKHYDAKVINFLFALIFYSNILINVDHGTFPGATEAMLTSIPLNKT